MSAKKFCELHLPPPPPCPPWCVSGVAEVVNHLVKKQNANPWQVEHILGFLSKNYLLSLPRLRNDKYDQSDTSAKRMRWLFYSWTARILRWTKRRDEGDEDALSPQVYRFIREVVYPSLELEHPTSALVEGTVCSIKVVPKGSQSSASTGTGSYTSAFQNTEVIDQLKQHFLNEGDIDNDGFIIEERFHTRDDCIKVCFFT